MSDKTATNSKAQEAHDDYIELNKISINDSDIILAENPDAEFRYRVVENRYTTYFNVLGDNNIYTGHTNDYIEALTEFINRAHSNAKCVQSRQNENESLHGIDYSVLTVNNCLPDSQNHDYTGKLIVVKASELKPEYRTADSQLMLCSHGNGARPNAIGISVFGHELLSGEYVCYGRHQIEGIANPKKMPDWAVEKMAVIESERAMQKKAQEAPKPSLQEKLSKAKEKAAQEAAKNRDRVNKPKKRKDMEVT